MLLATGWSHHAGKRHLRCAPQPLILGNGFSIAPFKYPIRCNRSLCIEYRHRPSFLQRFTQDQHRELLSFEDAAFTPKV